MHPTPVPFDSSASIGDRRFIIRRNPDDVQEIEMVDAIWGSDPRFADGLSFRFVRSERRACPDRRCLIPASEFHMTLGNERYRATLEGGNFFYLAAIWEPPLGEWPLSFRILTVAANSEIARYQERHGAIIHRRQVMHWLDGTVADHHLLATPPPRTFRVERLAAPVRQPALAI